MFLLSFRTFRGHGKRRSDRNGVSSEIADRRAHRLIRWNKTGGHSKFQNNLCKILLYIAICSLLLRVQSYKATTKRTEWLLELSWLPERFMRYTYWKNFCCLTHASPWRKADLPLHFLAGKGVLIGVGNEAAFPHEIFSSRNLWETSPWKKVIFSVSLLILVSFLNDGFYIPIFLLDWIVLLFRSVLLIWLTEMISLQANKCSSNAICKLS
jgi:hypothetical protein